MASTQASRRLGFGDVITIIIYRQGLLDLYDVFTHGGNRGLVERHDETASAFASRCGGGYIHRENHATRRIERIRGVR